MLSLSLVSQFVRFFPLWVFVCFVCLKQGLPVDKGKGRKDHLFRSQTAGFRLRTERTFLSIRPSIGKPSSIRLFGRPLGVGQSTVLQCPGHEEGTDGCFGAHRPGFGFSLPPPPSRSRYQSPDLSMLVFHLCDKPKAVALRSCLGNGTRSCLQADVQSRSVWGWGLWMRGTWPRLE